MKEFEVYINIRIRFNDIKNEIFIIEIDLREKLWNYIEIEISYLFF